MRRWFLMKNCLFSYVNRYQNKQFPSLTLLTISPDTPCIYIIQKNCNQVDPVSGRSFILVGQILAPLLFTLSITKFLIMKSKYKIPKTTRKKELAVFFFFMAKKYVIDLFLIIHFHCENINKIELFFMCWQKWYFKLIQINFETNISFDKNWWSFNRREA